MVFDSTTGGLEVVFSLASVDTFPPGSYSEYITATAGDVSKSVYVEFELYCEVALTDITWLVETSETVPFYRKEYIPVEY